MDSDQDTNLIIEQAKQRVLQSMSEQDRASKVFYINEAIYSAGSELDIDGQVHHLSTDTILIFVDEEPGANWAHQCRYILFNTNLEPIKEVPARFPPSLTKIPETFRLLSKPEGIPGWSLWLDE